jgi:hypothetical protein
MLPLLGRVGAGALITGLGRASARFHHIKKKATPMVWSSLLPGAMFGVGYGGGVTIGYNIAQGFYKKKKAPYRSGRNYGSKYYSRGTAYSKADSLKATDYAGKYYA